MGGGRVAGGGGVGRMFNVRVKEYVTHGVILAQMGNQLLSSILKSGIMHVQGLHERFQMSNNLPTSLSLVGPTLQSIALKHP